MKCWNKKKKPKHTTKPKWTIGWFGEMRLRNCCRFKTSVYVTQRQSILFNIIFPPEHYQIDKYSRKILSENKITCIRVPRPRQFGKDIFTAMWLSGCLN